jgi:hypothetical protein
MSITPKKHLSWSQMIMVEKSPETYKKVYIHDMKIINKGIILGKEISECLENDELTGNPVRDLVLTKFPKLDKMELELNTEIEVKGKKIELLSYLDTCSNDYNEFYEYKTGSTKWSQKKVDELGQITFYCVVIYELTGKIPNKIKLYYAPSQQLPNGKVELTGKIIEFETKRDTIDIIKMRLRMLKAWEKIQEITKEELL